MRSYKMRDKEIQEELDLLELGTALAQDVTKKGRPDETTVRSMKNSLLNSFEAALENRR